MYGKFQDFLKSEIQSIKDAGLYKTERLIATPQGAEIKLTTGETVLNFCANNYLGLSSHPKVIEGAKKGLDARGYGMSSVRSSVEPRIFTKNWKQRFPNSLVQKIQFYMQLVSMPTAVFLNPSSLKRTLSYLMN